MTVHVPARRIFAGAAVVLWLGGWLAGAGADDDILLERESPYVPSPQDVVERMIDLAGVQPGEFLIDLGSGDGRIVITAAQRGARGYGVDIDPRRVQESLENAARAGVGARATFEQKDLFDTDISRADVVTTYLLPLVNLDLRPRLLAQMRPGARLVTHAFHMGEWWPDATDFIRGRVLYRYVIPARAGGRWRVENEDIDFLLDIEQSFQTFRGTAHIGERTLPKTIEAHSTAIRDGRLNGTEISFAVNLGAGPRIFRGRVDGDTIHGLLPHGWKAVRTAR
ncbi:MAG: methyltransferase domain-containing protein [Hyphomicrobiales bacterium]|nr:methyltransferase domain-containing protein [Hyphomicrobiales bacterium]